MKILILVLVTLLFHSTADANSFDDCDKVGELAGIVMWLRQDDTPVSDVRQTGNSVDMTPEQRKAFMHMVIKAYEVPLLSTKKSKLRIIGEFRNEWTVACYGAMNRDRG